MKCFCYERPWLQETSLPGPLSVPYNGVLLHSNNFLGPAESEKSVGNSIHTNILFIFNIQFLASLFTFSSIEKLHYSYSVWFRKNTICTPLDVPVVSAFHHRSDAELAACHQREHHLNAESSMYPFAFASVIFG